MHARTLAKQLYHRRRTAFPVLLTSLPQHQYPLSSLQTWQSHQKVHLGSETTPTTTSFTGKCAVAIDVTAGWKAPRHVLPSSAGLWLTMCVDWSIPSKFCAFSKIKERSGAGYDWSRQIGCTTSMYTGQPCRLARAPMMHRAGLFSHRLLCLCVGGNATYTYVFRDAAQDFFLPNEYDEEAAVAHPPRVTSMMLHFCTTIQGRANECITPWWVPPGRCCSSSSSASLQETTETTENIPC